MHKESHTTLPAKMRTCKRGKHVPRSVCLMVYIRLHFVCSTRRLFKLKWYNKLTLRRAFDSSNIFHSTYDTSDFLSLFCICLQITKNYDYVYVWTNAYMQSSVDWLHFKIQCVLFCECVEHFWLCTMKYYLMWCSNVYNIGNVLTTPARMFSVALFFGLFDGFRYAFI